VEGLSCSCRVNILSERETIKEQVWKSSMKAIASVEQGENRTIPV
jgi:hypothetical protein